MSSYLDALRRRRGGLVHEVDEIERILTNDRQRVSETEQALAKARQRVAEIDNEIAQQTGCDS